MAMKYIFEFHVQCAIETSVRQVIRKFHDLIFI